MSPSPFADPHQPLFVISVAAELAGMHPQTLRQYDRLGLVTPSRLAGRARRYSPRDVEKLRQIQALSQEGVSLEGIRRIFRLEDQVEELTGQVQQLRERLQQAQDRLQDSGRVFAVAPTGGEVVRLGRGQRPTGPVAVDYSRALALYRPDPRQETAVRGRS